MESNSLKILENSQYNCNNKLSMDEIDSFESNSNYCREHIRIPQHISRYAHLSATFFLYNSILAYVLKYRVLSFLLLCLYITTILHWNDCKYGIIRNIDIIILCVTLAYVTFIESHNIFPKYRSYWFYLLGFVIIIHAINEYIFYMHTRNSTEYVYVKHTYKTWPLTFLNYTEPNTYKRELAYTLATYLHMWFVHIIPSIVSAGFAILSI